MTSSELITVPHLRKIDSGPNRRRVVGNQSLKHTASALRRQVVRRLKATPSLSRATRRILTARHS